MYSRFYTHRVEDCTGTKEKGRWVKFYMNMKWQLKAALDFTATCCSELRRWGKSSVPLTKINWRTGRRHISIRFSQEATCCNRDDVVVLMPSRCWSAPVVFTSHLVDEAFQGNKSIFILLLFELANVTWALCTFHKEASEEEEHLWRAGLSHGSGSNVLWTKSWQRLRS